MTMHILITGGGTKVPLDPVRNITNTSTGYLAASLAKAALKAGCRVTYLCAEDAQTPFAYHKNFYNQDNFSKIYEEMNQLEAFIQQYRSFYQEFRFRHFADYKNQVEQLTRQEKPDITILAAAVSDYLVENPTPNKLRSSEDLTLHLTTAPKIIHKIKTWHPKTFLIGFKLEVGASDALLVESALKSMHQHQLDLVVANDLLTKERKRHTILIVESDGSYTKYTEDLAENLIKRALKRWQK